MRALLWFICEVARTSWFRSGEKLNFKQEPYYSHGGVMNLRVKAIAAALAFLFVFGGAANSALADDDNNQPVTGPTPGATPGFGHHHHDEEKNELHDRYGDVGQVNLPPLVVKQGNKTGTASKNGVDKMPSTTKTTSLKDAGNADPVANVPVDPKSINPHQGTPADVFFNSATIGLGVMGVGVATLAAVAIRRAVRIRKDPKSDFLYQ
jgi:hypothetical protein